MGYKMCLEKAGATVHCFEHFGSYQGDWYAKVTYNGETGWVHGCYGSCSGCDAFEGEFGWADGDCEAHKYAHDDTCEACVHAEEQLEQRYAAFGATYLDGLYSQEKQEEVLENLTKDCFWGSEYREALDFVRSNRADQ